MPISISAAQIASAKRDAKELKAGFPDLPHRRRLDLIAQNNFGARNYHELLQWRDTTLRQHLVMTSQRMACCKFCGLEFNLFEKEELKYHQSRHETYEAVYEGLGYLPEPKELREVRKQRAYEIFQQDESATEHFAAALDILRAWFDRSLECGIRNNHWKQHPPFEQYVSYLTGDLGTFPAATVKALVERYGQVNGPIPQGKSYWYPKDE